MPKPPDIDFPTSSKWQQFYAESGRLPKFKKNQPKTVKVAGMTLNNIDPDAPLDEKTFPKVLENLKKLGIQPTTTKPPETSPSPLAEKTDFLDLVPTDNESSARGGKRLEQNIDKINLKLNQRGKGGEIARDRLFAPDASYDASMIRKQRRAANGLPEKAPPWKGLQQDFMALTSDQINFLHEVGFHPEMVRNPHSETVELMLLRLKQYGKL